jgi:hypothetical protein
MAQTKVAGGVCNITPIIPPSAKGPPTLPSIPTPTDLQSALQAIKALTQIVYALTGQSGNQGGYGSQGGKFIVLPQQSNGGGGGSGGGQNQSGGKGNFQEVKSERVSQTIKVYNPQDNSQYVTVNQITGLTFRDSITGQLISWSQ